MTETSDLLVFWAIIAARFLVPLAIPRYPLPAIVGALILDMIDQTIFQRFTNLPLEGYQGYDKSLDVYYLAIAYISTLRNWTNLFAFKLGRFLFYYRLVGVALFELTQLRPLLLIFPNTFEYFFIFYEAVRLRWNPVRLTKRKLIGTAAFIWIVIKLPQEYWIHIAQMDTTDWIRSNPLNILVLVAWVAVMIIAAWLLLRGMSPDRQGLVIAADPIPSGTTISAKEDIVKDTIKDAVEDIMKDAVKRTSEQLINGALIEKIVLVSLLSIIFAQVLPEVKASNLQIAVGVAILVVINTALSHWLSRRGTGWRSILQEFVVISAVNFSLILAIDLLLPKLDGSIDLENALFLVLLLTLNVTMYDRYRQVHMQRFAGSG